MFVIRARYCDAFRGKLKCTRYCVCVGVGDEKVFVVINIGVV